VLDLLLCAKHLFVGAKIVFVQKIDLGTRRQRRRRRSQLLRVLIKSTIVRHRWLMSALPPEADE
jgi:hypothetical protein